MLLLLTMLTATTCICIMQHALHHAQPQPIWKVLQNCTRRNRLAVEEGREAVQGLREGQIKNGKQTKKNFSSPSIVNTPRPISLTAL